MKPPFPAVAGLYQCPTAVNNVETLCNVPPIMLRGAEWFVGLGPEKNGGPKLYCISGHVKKPGVYEASMHTTLRELIYDYAGGEVNDPLPFADDKINLRGYGVGLQFGISEKFRLRMDAAKADSAALPINGKDPQYWASFSYTF